MASTLVVMTTSIVALISGFMLGVYSIKGYLISPELSKESRANYDDPVDSDETDIDEDATVLDHAPNWANGEEADRKQGLRMRKGAGGDNKKTKTKKTAGSEEASTGPSVEDTGEECKLVLVVRTDLGMTKGEYTKHASFSRSFTLERERRGGGERGVSDYGTDPFIQAKSLHNAPTQHWPATRPSPAKPARQALPALPPEYCRAGNVLVKPRSPCKSSPWTSWRC